MDTVDQEIPRAAVLRVLVDDHMAMDRQELADRMAVSRGHIDHVLCGSRPASMSFMNRFRQVLRAFDAGTLSDYVPREPKPKIGSGHVGSGALLPEDYEPSPPSRPTNALRGSRAKVEEMRLRAERGEELWHPKDSPMMKRLEDD